MTIKHTFTSDLGSEFPTFDDFVEQRLGSEKGTQLIAEKPGVEFAAFYDFWVNEFKITHVIEEDGKDSKTIAHTSLTETRIQFCKNVVNTLAMGKTLEWAE